MDDKLKSMMDARFGVPLERLMPKVNYGQADGQAWNPSTRADVYQQAEKARSDAAFANLFAADIIFSKQATGSKAYDRNGNAVNLGRGYLYNKNSLNASQSWAGQAFGAPAVKGEDGNWYTAYGQLNAVTIKKTTRIGGRETGLTGSHTVYRGDNSSFGFVQGERITDEGLLRQLNEGVYAFTAKGNNGATVYVPYASGYQLQKGQGGKPEAGNYKQDVAQGATNRDARNQWNVQPNVVSDPLGLQQTLLGGAAARQNKSKTLLG